MSVYSLCYEANMSVKEVKGSFTFMSYGNRFAQLTTEAAEKAAELVLTQLSERIIFSKLQSRTDKEMECLHFGICSYQTEPHRVIL